MPGVVIFQETGAHFDARDNVGRTPLSYAVENRAEAVAKLMLETGQANIDLKNRDGNTPLIYAAGNGRQAVIKILLQSNADGDTVKLLIEIGRADANAVLYPLSQTPLSYAVAKGYGDIVKLLLEVGGVDVHAEDQYGQVPLSHAAARGTTILLGCYSTLVGLMSTGRTSITVGSHSRMPLANGHCAVVKLLLETRKVDIKSVDEYCRSPLSYAAANGHKIVINLLLEIAEVDVSLEDIFGRTLLSCAIKNKHDAIIQLLQSISAIQSTSPSLHTQLSLTA
ncbi:hypothetical protein FHL15_005398 [Xylaria flabelliformis]|uniref:Uncharacterized protein n=1 Tax=Xylaria flabelliformis TaxID=2512241 RepID=A0A553I0K4_9PEZI|nr:hypothetical protein FHL15_005398 [Xylaria flabelliformis]